MIRILTLGEMPAETVEFVARRLYAAYGIGAEHAGNAEAPPDAINDRGAIDADVLLKESKGVKTFADDKILFLTSDPLDTPEGPMGRGPVLGYAQYGGERAVATSAGLKGLSVQDGLAKRAAHHVGHLFDLHHCFDPRCAMYPEWAPAFAQFPEVALCPFDREKSERKIRLAGV